MPTLSDNQETNNNPSGISQSLMQALNPSDSIGGKKRKNKSTKKNNKKSVKKLNKKTKKTGKKLNKYLSKWILHVKQYAAEHGIKYNEALKKASKTFKK
jgi:hypothetical protein